jgi:hypothetical protein
MVHDIVRSKAVLFLDEDDAAPDIDTAFPSVRSELSQADAVMAMRITKIARGIVEGCLRFRSQSWFEATG